MINTEDIVQGCNLQLIGDVEKDNKTERIKLIRKDMIESFPSIDNYKCSKCIKEKWAKQIPQLHLS